MAYVFSLSVECGLSTTAAAAVGDELRELLQVSVRQRRFRDTEDGAWVSLVVDNVNLDDTTSTGALAKQLQSVLAATPLPFRFGLAGVEVDEARTWRELVDDIKTGSLMSGVVLNHEVWTEVGSPSGFVPLGRHLVSSKT